MKEENYGYVVVTDYVTADGKEDVSEKIQKLIDENPNKTIFFPDGKYLLSQPILTPAHPERSVDLRLSNFACLVASKDWAHEEAMVRLGAKDSANCIEVTGSNYGLCGGFIDAGGKATAVSIEGGRETFIREINIKNAKIGLHISHGANSGSSDADIFNVNIVGNGSVDSIGVLLDGFDNTLTNMRIANVFTGVVVRSGGNMLRNIHPLYYINEENTPRYDESVGFRIENGMNWFDYCYSDQFAVGFETEGGGVMKNCFCWWYSGDQKTHLGVKSLNPFYGSIDTLVLGGQEHPESPLKFMESPEMTDNANIRDVRIGTEKLY